jgi:hypothetical protein
MKYALIALVVGLGACDDGSSDSGDTATGTTNGTPGNPALEIVSYDPVCTNDTTYNAELTTTAPTNGAALINMWETNSSNGFSEEHMLVSDVATDDHLSLTLNFTDDINDIDNDNGTGVEPTLFSCAADGQFQDDTTMTYAIRIYDPSGQLAQCCAFGFTPEVVAAGTYIAGGGDPSAKAELDTCVTTCGGL